jgi:hypothetical protein
MPLLRLIKQQENSLLGDPSRPAKKGNPKGRPKGARNRLSTQFLEALEADFNQFGIQAIALVRGAEARDLHASSGRSLAQGGEHQRRGW